MYINPVQIIVLATCCGIRACLSSFLPSHQLLTFTLFTMPAKKRIERYMQRNSCPLALFIPCVCCVLKTIRITCHPPHYYSKTVSKESMLLGPLLSFCSLAFFFFARLFFHKFGNSVSPPLDFHFVYIPLKCLDLSVYATPYINNS